MPKISSEPLNGILLIDKPVDWTSHDVVAKLRSLLRMRRIGHTGTLDPFASGLLMVCLDRSTRLVQFLTGHEKEYLATLRLGWQTETGDWTGARVSPQTDAQAISREAIEAVLPAFRGKISQIPPMYSARKQAGRKLYELAREGKVVERSAVEVEIRELELGAIRTAVGNPDETPSLLVDFRVVCSAGTYIRTLAEEIGARLGVGAHLTTLRRIRVGPCRIEAALQLAQIADLAASQEVRKVLLSPVEVLDLPILTASGEEVSALLHGQSISHEGSWQEGEQIIACDAENRLIAILQYQAGKGRLAPRVVLGQAVPHAVHE
jgi:tRNA pseudouridine55 synthase